MTTIFYPAPAGTAPYVPDIAWKFDKVDPFDASALAWGEMVASTPEDWSGVGLNLIGDDQHHKITHIATGDSGSEVIVATFPAPEVADANQRPSVQFAPVFIPAGTRISVGGVGSTNVTRPAQIWGLTAADAGGASGFTNVDAGPFLIQNSGDQEYEWVSLTAPTVVDTFGAWKEISHVATTASVSNNILNGDSLAHQYSFLMPMLHFVDTASNTNVDFVFQIAVGDTGAEVVVSEWTAFFNTNDPQNNLWGITALPIIWGHPAGSRVSVRYRASDLSVDPAPKLILMGIR